VRRAACQILLRPGGKSSEVAAVLDRILQAELQHLAKTFPRRACRLSRATRNFCMRGVPQPSEHFELTLQDCGGGKKLQSAAWGRANISEPRAERGGRQAKELLGKIPSSKANYTTLTKHGTRRALRLSTTRRNFCICGLPQLQDCDSGQKLQSAVWGEKQFSPTPGRARGKAKEGAAGLARILQAELTTNISREEYFDCPGPDRMFCICGILLPSEHLRIHTLRLRQWAATAKCGVGPATFFSEHRPCGGEGEGRSCWDGSHPPSRSCKTLPKHFP
jgi:hypothetical protein